jgi:hypothetical protein
MRDGHAPQARTIGKRETRHSASTTTGAAILAPRIEPKMTSVT